jgi:aspartate aminotransferase
LNEAARLLRERGEPVINLTVGEPKNKTPINAVLSSAAKLTAGDVKYTPTDGIPSLKKAISRYTEENYRRLPAPENIIISAGAKQSLYNIFFTLLNPGDEVIVLAPYWVSYPEMIKMCYGVPVIVTPGDGGFLPHLNEIEAVLTNNTKAIIVNSPNNPSGMVYEEALIAGLVELCERKGLYLIMDDIYHKLVFGGARAPVAWDYTTEDIENSRVIVVNGVAKLYGMTGFRIGWVVAPRKLVQVMTNVQAQTTSCTSVVLQAAAEGALTGLQSTVDSLRLSIENTREVVVKELQTFTGVKLIPPQGAFYVLPDFSAYNRNSVELADFLLKKALVVTVPGKEFGMEGHLRLSYSGGVKDVQEGLARMKWALDPQSPNEIYIGDRRMARDWM